MDPHSVLCNVVAEVVVTKPKKTEKVSVLFLHIETIKHLLDICHEGNCFFSEAHEDAKD